MTSLFHNYSSSQMKVYAKDSFDRFGDDLTELILQYMTLEDKVRLECVSKLWRRLVFNKQFVIKIYDKTTHKCEKEKNNSLKMLYWRSDDNRGSDEQILESLLKKCPNIRKVILLIEVSSEVLSLFGQYCPHIKSLRVIIDSIESLDFFINNGHKLEELIIYEIDDYWETVMIIEVLELCPNLKKVKLKNVANGLDYLIRDKDFLPKLEYFGNKPLKSNLLSISFKEVKKLKILSNKYSKTIKTLKVQFCRMSYGKLKTSIGYICRLENLKQLKLKVSSDRITEPIDDCLSLIGQKCTKLLELYLEIDYYVPISDRFFDVFTHFKAIKILRIELPNNMSVFSGSVECFKHCKQLYDIDINNPELKEDFFTNIATFLPKLQSLNIYTSIQFSDSFIDSFHAMKDIQNIELIDNNEFLKMWKFGKRLTDMMLSPNGKRVIRVNDNCGRVNYDFDYVRNLVHSLENNSDSD